MQELEEERLSLEAEKKRISQLVASLVKIKNEQLVVCNYGLLCTEALLMSTLRGL